MSLKDKTIVVTGGSRGLGLGLVEALGACPGNSKKRSGQGASSSIRWTV